jgi:hypothetical protein
MCIGLSCIGLVNYKLIFSNKNNDNLYFEYSKKNNKDAILVVV